MSIDLEAIRARYAMGWRRALGADNLGITAHEDRGVLLAEVDRLTAELAETRAAYDAVCRSIGASLRRSAAE